MSSIFMMGGIALIIVTFIASALAALPVIGSYMSFFTTYSFLLYPTGAFLMVYGLSHRLILSFIAFVAVIMLINFGGAFGL